MTDTQLKILSPSELQSQEVAELKIRIWNLTAELNHYRDENKNPSWLQIKMMGQAKALTRLNRRVRFQRIILRELNAHHPELAEELFQLAKSKEPHIDDISTF